MTREQFNETLYIFENWGIGQLRDTPLASKLFSVISAQNADKNTVTVDQLIEQTLRVLLNQNDAQILTSFYIYDRNHDKCITQEEFTNFITESWTAAFRILAKMITYDSSSLGNMSSVQQLTAKAVENFANENIYQVSNVCIQEFGKFDMDKNGYWDYNDFKEWVKKSPHNSIVASYENYSIEIPLHLGQFGAH